MGGNVVQSLSGEPYILNPGATGGERHGIEVGGVIGATTDNGKHISGAAWNPRIITAGPGATSIDNIRLNTDADIINMSWLIGNCLNFTSLRGAIKDALKEGIVLVAGAGNTARSLSNSCGEDPHNPNEPFMAYPAAYDFTNASTHVDSLGKMRVISVAGTYYSQSADREQVYNHIVDGHSWNFVEEHISIFDTNYFNESLSADTAQIDIAAPARRIVTLYGSDVQGTTFATGTSFASPYVSSVIGLILSIQPQLTHKEIYDILTKTTNDVPFHNDDPPTFYNHPDPNDNRKWNGQSGFGRLNAYEALKYTIENHGATLGGIGEEVVFHEDIFIRENSVVTIKAGTILNMKGDIVVENYGELHIEEGVTINADPGTRIVTKPGPGSGPGEPGGTVEAISNGNPIVMQPSGGGTWGGIVFESHNNVLDNVHISGVGSSSGAIRIKDYNLNTIKNSVIEDNQYGVLVDNVNSVSIIDNHIVNNSQEGLVLLNVLDDISTPGVVIKKNTISGNGRQGVFLFGSTIVNFSENIIEDNGEHGIWLSAFSSIYFNYDDYGYNRIKNNDNHQVWLTTTGDAFIGGNQTFGNNTIYHTNQPNTNKLIYRLALTGSGYQQASYQVFAQQTYWGQYSVSSGPSSSQFVGNVDYSNHLSSDPTGGSGPSSLSQPLAGGSVSTQTLMSADMVSAVTSAYEGNPEGARRAVQLSERVMHLRDVLANTPAEAYNARRIHELYTIKMLDPSDKSGLQDIIVATFHEWSEDSEQRLTNFEGDQADWVQLARESAMIQRVRLAMLDGDYIEVKRLTDRYGSQVHNKDYRVALKHGLMSIAMQNQQHKSASQLLSDINRIEPEQEVAGWYEAPDYRPLADYLAYAQNHTGDKGGSVRLARYEGAANLSDDLAAAEPLPEQFALSANYPNPFNPVTVIPFTLPMQADVLIEVFDISGRRVARLTDRQYEAGHHQVSFDAGSLASGVYLIRAVMRSVEGGDHQFTRKMALVK